LGILRSFFDIVSDDGDIFEIESRVDLVHEIERSGFVVMEGKDERE
jgi:hypothetical protein